MKHRWWMVGLALGAMLALAVSAFGQRSSAKRAGSVKKLVYFSRPDSDQLIRRGRTRLVIRTRSGARPTKVDIDGVVVTRRLRAGRNGTYTAKVSLGHGLHYGVNDAFVHTAGKDTRRTFDHVRFIVAKRDHGLLRLSSLRIAASGAPVQPAIDVAKGANVRAYVNGGRADGAFARDGSRAVGGLGANDGLHVGRNRVLLLVHKTHPFRRQSTYDAAAFTVRINRNQPIAGAGSDRKVTQNSLVQLDGGASKVPPRSARRSFRWKIVHAPEGSKAKLRNASGRRPLLTPDQPGSYSVRLMVRGKGRRASSGIAAAVRSAVNGDDQTASSSDTVTLTSQPDIPPDGVRLNTLQPDRAVLLGGKPLRGPQCCLGSVNYVVIDRRTLAGKDGGSAPASVEVGSVTSDVDGLKKLEGIIDGYTGVQNYLVVLNWVDFDGTFEPVRNEFDNVLTRIGGQKLTDSQRKRITNREAPGSAVGVAGAPAGSAFVTVAYKETPECGSGPCDAWPTVGGMSGSLRLNGETGKYDFVFTDYVDFDTEVNQTQTQFSPPQLTINVGDKSYTLDSPAKAAPGTSGFHLLRLNAKTLEPLADFAYHTNTPTGSEETAEVQRLATDLKFSADQLDRPLVILQAYGAPHGNDDAWDQAAKQVERLGGTRQVFDALNATDPREVNGEDPKRKGPYALVGRVNASAPWAEQSYPLTGLPGRIRGVLMRGRDGGFEPMVAGPARSTGQTPVNTELMHITEQPAQAFPAFKDSNGHPVDAANAQAVQNFLGGPDVMAVCSEAATNCDIRKSYYESYEHNWASAQDDLTNAKDKCDEVNGNFTAEQCEGMRTQLRNEVSKVAKVTQYFGPVGLKQPFGAAGVAALADLFQISEQIKGAVAPPADINTTSKVLTGISWVLKIGAFSPPPGNQVFAGLSGVFGTAGYFTHSDGGSGLIGAQLTTTAGKLGVELADQYRQAGTHLDDVGRIIVSDYGKLTTVAAKASAAPGPGEIDWRLGQVAKTAADLQLAAKRMIYERLVPLAYPVMYDLGESGNARIWYCDGPTLDKYLFNEQADSAQFSGRFLKEKYSPTIAIAQEHAVGHLRSARIPGLLGSIADTLFKQPENGGIGFTKLEFYSPRNGFRYFPAEPTRFPKSEGEHGDWNSLNQFPRGRPDVIGCPFVPIPPGNSG